MAQKLNKHTHNSEDLLKRLNSNDSAGLDDFEKEALEGFASLENPALAQSLNKQLDAKLNEVYFEKKSGKGTFFYLSMAAGLVVVVGLSILFYTFFVNQKQELALNNETELTEKLPGQPSTSFNETNTVVNESNSQEDGTKSNGSGKAMTDHDQSEKKQSQILEKDAISHPSGMNKDTKPADTETSVSKPIEDANNGPATKAPVPVTIVSEEQKEPARSEKVADKEAPGKTIDENNKDLNEARPRSTIGGLKKKSAKTNAPAESEKKEESKGEGLADDKKADEAPKLAANQSVSSSAAGAVSGGDTRRDDGLFSPPVFAQKNYSKPQEYIKDEIEKNVLLKTNVKAFKAKVTIDEKGKVTKVKFLTSFTNCSNCEKQLESILLNMPNWQAATQAGKKTKEIIDFVFP